MPFWEEGAIRVQVPHDAHSRKLTESVWQRDPEQLHPKDRGRGRGNYFDERHSVALVGEKEPVCRKVVGLRRIRRASEGDSCA